MADCNGCISRARATENPMRPTRHHISTLLLALVCLATAGCYDGDKLVEQVRDTAIRTRLEEVEVGAFRTTLPRDTLELTRLEVDIELFGTAVRYKIPDIEEKLEFNAHRLRQSMLVALRETTADETYDPDLVSLRGRLLIVVNEYLDETPFQSLGIRHVRFIPL